MFARKKVLIAVLIALGIPLLVAAAILAIWLFWPRPALKLDPDTTFVTGPLYPDGTVDYVAAYNAIMEKGVTPQNNAAIPLIEALVDRRDLRRHWKQELRALGMRQRQLPKTSLPEYSAWRADYEKTLPIGARKAPPSGFAPNRHPPEHCPWSANKHPLLAKFLLSQKQRLRLVRQAVKRPRLFFPLPQPARAPYMMRASPGPLSQIQHAGRDLCRQAMFELQRRRLRACLRDLRAVSRLAALMSQGHALSYEIGLELRWVAAEDYCAIACAMCGRHPVAPAGLQIAPPKLLLARSTAGLEYRFSALDAAMSLFRAADAVTNAHGVKPLPLNENFILRKLNTQYNRLAGALSAPTFTAATLQLRLAKRQFLKWQHEKSVDPSMALFQRLDSTLWPSLIGEISLQYEGKTAWRLAQIAMALAKYRQKHSAFPATLSALRGKNAKFDNLDPFSGHAFDYQRTAAGCIVSSVGPSPNMSPESKERHGVLLKMPN